MQGVNGVRGFLDRVWRMIVDGENEELRVNPAVHDATPTAEQNRMLHRTIKAVTDDIVAMSFNTAIARMMEFVNYFTKETVRPRAAMERFVLLLSPYAPHLAEELWRLLGHAQTLAYEPWPAYDPELIKEAEVEIAVQIMGKVRARVVVPAGADKDAIEAAARADEKVQSLLAGKKVVKVIVAPGRLINFVAQ
jgi:leucyl-tRNA synthetase